MDSLINKQYGRLTVIERVSDQISPCGTHHVAYLCRCECGNEKIIRKSSIINGRTVSCGCYHIEKSTTHGMKNTRLYRIWQGMKQRCYGNHCAASNYKNRNITVCNEWLDDFKKFYEWSIQNGYSDNLTIDRINVNGNYEPSNCRWVNYVVQENNRRNNIKIAIDGEELTVQQLSKKIQIKETSIRTVIRRNSNSIKKVVKHRAKGGEYICFNCTRDMFQLKTRNV